MGSRNQPLSKIIKNLKICYFLLVTVAIFRLALCHIVRYLAFDDVVYGTSLLVVCCFASRLIKYQKRNHGADGDGCARNVYIGVCIFIMFFFAAVDTVVLMKKYADLAYCEKLFMFDRQAPCPWMKSDWEVSRELCPLRKVAIPMDRITAYFMMLITMTMYFPILISIVILCCLAAGCRAALALLFSKRSTDGRVLSLTFVQSNHRQQNTLVTRINGPLASQGNRDGTR